MWSHCGVCTVRRAKTDRRTPPKPTRPGLWSDRVFGGTSVTACSTSARHPVSAAEAWVGPYTAVPLGFWRALGASLNTLAIESLIDQLVAAAGADCRGCRWRLTATWSSTLAWLTRRSAAGRGSRSMSPACSARTFADVAAQRLVCRAARRHDGRLSGRAGVPDSRCAL